MKSDVTILVYACKHANTACMSGDVDKTQYPIKTMHIRPKNTNNNLPEIWSKLGPLGNCAAAAAVRSTVAQ